MFWICPAVCAFRLILLAARSRAARCLSRELVWFLFDARRSWRGDLQPRCFLWLGAFRQTCLGIDRESCCRQAAVFTETVWSKREEGQCLGHPEGTSVWPSCFLTAILASFCASVCAAAWQLLALSCCLAACNEQKQRNSSSLLVTVVSRTEESGLYPSLCQGKHGLVIETNCCF